MHTFFALEDIYGLQISKIKGELCISPDKDKGIVSQTISGMFQAWQEQAERLQSGEITKKEYDQWRYTYPQMSAAKSKESVDALRAKQTAQTPTKKE